VLFDVRQKMSFPTARISERRFVILHFESASFKRCGPHVEPIIGFTLEVMLRDNPAKPHRFVISACGEGWKTVERRYYHDFVRPLRDADLAGIVRYEDWRFTQPERGCKLYSRPRSRLEIKHRRVKELLQRFLSEQQLAKLATPESLLWVARSRD
jgi:hypothetical protein